MDLTEKVNPYEIQLNQSNSARSSIFIPENRVVFAPECPVSILAEKSWCPGRIICCDIKRNSQDPAAILQPSYIVQLHRNHGVFQRVQGIEPGRIKYRKIDEELSPSFHTTNHANQCRSQFGTSGKKELTDDERCGDEIKSSQMSPQNFEKFSPKSPMSTPDHRPQKLPNGVVKNTACNDDVERALPRLGKMDRVGNQSPEGKTQKYSSIDAAMAPPKWNLPASRCAQIPNEVPVYNAQETSSNDRKSLNHTPRPPKWHPPVSHDVSTPKRFSSGEVTGVERKRARSPSSSRGTSAKDLTQKFARERESSERIPHCRVHFPKWLFYDNMAKDHIIYQFTKKNYPPENMNLLTVIGQKTNCFLRTENCESSRIFDRTNIFIESKNMTNAPTNVREAKEQIEDFLLKYIQHDGCQGRLFYDIARCDEVFHPRSNVRHFAGSIAIMQRNPFSGRREFGWMSVVELPFEVDLNSRRLYHGHSLIDLQSRLRSEFSCFIKLCGNEFKRYPIKYGYPYAWVWGKQSQDVDRAIEVILAALKQHRRECRRCQFEGR